jgi:hypothetical protein
VKGRRASAPAELTPPLAFDRCRNSRRAEAATTGLESVFVFTVPKNLATVFVLCLTTAGLSVSAAAGERHISVSNSQAPYHIRFKQPVPLTRALKGEVSSEAPSRYRANVKIKIGGYIGSPALRTLVRLRLRGQSDQQWSPLHVHLSRRQFDFALATARRERRRPVLEVQLKGPLGAHVRQFVMSLP